MKNSMNGPASTVAVNATHRGAQLFTVAALLSLGAWSAGYAQGTAFPAESRELTEGELKDQLAGKTFGLHSQDGSGIVRMFFKADGYLFLNMAGFSTSGKWSVKNTALCTEAKDVPTSCNEVRLLDDKLFIKRDSGKVEQFQPA